MPQFNLADAMPQILWLGLVFLILYLSMLALLPKVDKIVEDRKARISSDLSAAEAAHAAAQGAQTGGSNILTDARNKALSVTAAARDTAAATTAARLAEVDSRLETQAGAAAAGLATARAAVIAELDQVAAEATVDLVRRVAGISVSGVDAAAVVKKIAA